MKTRRMMKRSGGLLILIFLLTALLLWPGALAVVWQNGEPGLRFDLLEYSSSSSGKFPVGGVVLEITEGKLRFLSSPCPDQICTETGFIGRLGEGADCLPGRVSVNIASGEAGL